MLMCIASHHHQLLVFGLPYIALYSLSQSLQITINHLPLKLFYTRYIYYHSFYTSLCGGIFIHMFYADRFNDAKISVHTPSTP